MSLFSKRYKTVSPDFIGKLPETGKILVIDIAGLGDLGPVNVNLIAATASGGIKRKERGA